MSHAENFLGEISKDKARHKPLVKMKVHNRNTNNLTLHGNLVPPGEHEIVVYADHVEKILAQVETDGEDIALAKREFQRMVAQEVKDKLEGYTGTIADLVRMLESKDIPDDIAQIYKNVLANTGKSLQGAFWQANGRDLKPLVSAEVIEGSEHLEHHRVTQMEEAGLIQRVLANAGHAPIQSPAGVGNLEELVQKLVQDELRRIASQKNKG